MQESVFSRPGAHRRLATAVALGVAVLALFSTAFVLAGHDPSPHRLPVGVVGAPALAEEVRSSLTGVEPDGFTVRALGTADEARRAVLDRDVYGVLVPGATGDRLLLASGASAPVAQLLEGVFGGRAAAQGRALQTEDLRPLAAGDPRGVALGLLVLPLVIASILAGAVLALLAPGSRPLATLIALTAVAAVGGGALIVPARLVDALPGDVLGLLAVAALAVLAIAATSRGLIAVAGTRAVGAAFLVFLLVGNLGSGANTAPELLVGPWRVVGPYLPPGAATTALRNVAYFEGAALSGPLLVLACWATLGIAMGVIGARRDRRPAAAPAEHAVTR